MRTNNNFSYNLVYKTMQVACFVSIIASLAYAGIQHSSGHHKKENFGADILIGFVASFSATLITAIAGFCLMHSVKKCTENSTNNNYQNIYSVSSGEVTPASPEQQTNII